MFIAFEGPDRVGKSTTAKLLDCAGAPDYQVTKAMHAQAVASWNGDAEHDPMPHTYDRISWFSHMVYRLALPDREWHDEAVRTVFAMPDTHLVVMLHRPDTAAFTETDPDSRTGLVVDTPIAPVNQAYYLGVDYLGKMNYAQDYKLFKSISVVEVVNDSEGYSMRVVHHDSPISALADRHQLWNLVDSPEELLKFLQHVNHQLG